MEAQMQRQHGHAGQEEVYPDMQGEEGHHEKKSMLKNVKEKTKEKAKKIKEKLTKHGHGQDHDHNSHDQDQEEFAEDNSEERVQDPEIHGAPMYESAAIRSGVGAGQQLGVNLEKPTTMEEDRYDTSITDSPTRPFYQPEHEKSGQGQFGDTAHMSNVSKGSPRVKIGNPTAVEEDPNAPKDGQEPSNYQSKVADPTKTGRADAGITPILQSFDKMCVHDDPHPPQSKSDEPQKMFTGSHDQFSPEPIPENTPVDPKEGSTFKALASGEKHGGKQTGYTEKISSATSAAALTERAVAAKNIVAFKLGYGEKEGSGISESGNGGEKSGVVGATVADYGNRAAATVTNVGSAMLSKVQGGSAGQTGENKGPNKGVKDYLSEKLRPSEEDKALSEVISETLRWKKSEAEPEDRKKREAAAEEDKPVGKVMLSEEVESRLGIGKEEPKREKETEDAQVEINANPAVLERVKGWFGIGQSQSPTAKDSEGERRLQESSN